MVGATMASKFLNLVQAYRPSTLNVIAQEVLDAGKGGAVACVCCPSIFLALREAAPDVPCMLLDFNPLYQVT